MFSLGVPPAIASRKGYAPTQGVRIYAVCPSGAITRGDVTNFQHTSNACRALSMQERMRNLSIPRLVGLPGMTDKGVLRKMRQAGLLRFR